MSDMSYKYLFVTFEGGGNVPPVLGVVKQLAARGHRVQVLTEPCLQEAVEKTEARFTPFTRHFTRHERSQDLIGDSRAKNPLAALSQTLNNVSLGPAAIVARETKHAINHYQPDVVVADFLMPAALMAAEAAGILRVALFHMPEYLPGPGKPAAGPGFLPRNDLLGKFRNKLLTHLFLKQFGRYLDSFNKARGELELPPLASAQDIINQYHNADLRLIQTCKAFDFPINPAPKNVCYVGPVLDDPDWAGQWQSPWNEDDSRPLVVVSLSSTFQDQQATLEHIMTALSKLDVRGLVTLGPAMMQRVFTPPKNVELVDSVAHSQVFPQADLVITHAGHGTVMRALAHGLPLLCLPMGRDQDDNAAKVFARGAGLRLRPKATPSRIASAIERLLEQPGYRSNAKKLCQQIRLNSGAEHAVRELETLAQLAR